MKKILAIFILLFSLTGCGNNTAKNAVENYMKKYKTLDSEVLVDLESTIEAENLSDSQEEVYRDILKKQYKDLKYEVVDEEYENDVTYVTVKVSVYNLYKSNEDSAKYLENNRTEFNNDKGEYDLDKYLDFKLDRMKKTTEKVDYTIRFKVTKENDKYVVSQPSETDLQKIHGIYNTEDK